MSDNNKIPIQDRGWNDMRAILDRELPEKNKKRRFGFWFFFGSAAIAVVVIAALLLLPQREFSWNSPLVTNKKSAQMDQLPSEVDGKSEDREGTEKVSGTEHPVSLDESLLETVESNPSEESSVTNASPENTDGNAYAQSVQPKPVAELKKNNKVKREEATQKLTNHQGIVLLDTPQNTTPIKEEGNGRKREATEKDTDENTVHTEASYINPIESDSKDIGPIHEEDQDRNLLESFMTLPLEDIPLMSSEKAVTFASAPKVEVQDDRRFSPYLLALANYQSDISGKGFGVGAGLSYGNKGFQIYAESSYLLSNFKEGEVSNDRIGVVSDQGNSEVFDNNQNEGIEFTPNAFSLSVSKLSSLTTDSRELNLKIGVRKSLGAGFSLDAGVAYVRLLSASNRRLDINLDETTGLENTATTIFVKSSAFFDYGIYSKYDIRPQLGVEYAITPHLGFGAYYSYGLKNLIASTNINGLMSTSASDEIYRRHFGAKVRFSF